MSASQVGHTMIIASNPDGTPVVSEEHERWMRSEWCRGYSAGLEPGDTLEAYVPCSMEFIRGYLAARSDIALRDAEVTP